MARPRSMISLLLLFIPCFASESIGYEPQEEEWEEFSEELLLKPLPDRKIQIPSSSFISTALLPIKIKQDPSPNSPPNPQTNPNPPPKSSPDVQRSAQLAKFVLVLVLILVLVLAILILTYYYGEYSYSFFVLGLHWCHLYLDVLAIVLESGSPVAFPCRPQNDVVLRANFQKKKMQRRGRKERKREREEGGRRRRRRLRVRRPRPSPPLQPSQQLHLVAAPATAITSASDPSPPPPPPPLKRQQGRATDDPFPIVLGLHWCHLYLDVLAISAILARAIQGLELEPQFNEPYLSTSLQDFWGRRSYLMITSILRPTVYIPIRCISTRMLGRSPTWEITWFFVFHGVCTAAEVAVKKAVGGEWQLHKVVSRLLTVGFLAVASAWSKHIPRGITRLLFLIPILSLFILLPFNLHSLHLGGPTTFYLVWLANFKLLLFSFDMGPLPDSKSLLNFISNALLPIQIKHDPFPKSTPNPKTNPNPPPDPDLSSNRARKVQRSALLAIKVLLLAMVIRLYDYRQHLHPNVILVLYCCHVYLAAELILAMSAFLARAILGLEPRTTVQRALLSHLTARLLGPTWEVTWYFVLHGVCTAAEVTAKKAVGERWRLHRVFSGPLTVGFVMLTAFWLFFPQIIRNGVDQRAIGEYSILVDFFRTRVQDFKVILF
ncbi:hypothetical protein HYC85_014882 [Camellia sinensis]|uniref:Wax synthase domain-containing protein n=1 Tax=Camellia sinensis TaxID=4442 RepID=A0A7J7H8L3_CAMSI|nr:hypothetical protein HYC85_014882 [Camellia sinensis]